MKHKTSIISLLFLFCTISLLGQELYTIYPIPQEQIIKSAKVSFTPQVSVIAEKDIDKYTCERVKQILKEKGLQANFVGKPTAGESVIYLGINGSNADADRKASKLKIKRDIFNMPKYDKHVVSLTSYRGEAQLLILGENTDAVFYGLATLEQMFDRGTKNLSCVTFYDFADVQTRGIIEGYYGVPYSEEVTADLFRFMARYKLNTYMYGAKSDPYHSRYWDKEYPTKLNDNQKRFGLMTQDMMRNLCNVASECKVNFIWSIHPGASFTDPKSTDVLDRIMSKLEKMYELGVRAFGVFVDDVGVPSNPAVLKQGADRLIQLQERIDTKWNVPGAKREDKVKPLQYVPQLYAYSWVKPEKARAFWESLRPVPEKVNIYTTGKNVWSVPNSKDLDVLKGYLGKELSWWWNYPCNDVDVTKIFVADTYTNFKDETHIDSEMTLENNLSLKTIVINPMQQGELSKIALFSVGDYTWNMSQFNNMESWKASLKAVIGKQKAQTFEQLVPYLRYYDGESKLSSLIEEFKKSYKENPSAACSESLEAELAQIIENCDIIAQMKDSKCKSDSLFYADLKPWLTKLKSMAVHSTIMLKALKENGETAIDRVTFAKSWSAIEGIEKSDEHRFDILKGMGSDITLSVQTAQPAHESLKPFLDWLLQQF
ncbi:MAG: beta-N-acetylglucosaminidase domain-containing protein [Bacteroidia bacterium]|nr:beta-N-acetylglucosaminidase domain-containing protein [Bacteroidia bacterium]